MVTYWNRAQKTFLQAMTGSSANGSGEQQSVRYLLTGNECPGGLSARDKSWAYLSSRVVADHQHKGLKLLHMFHTGHQWPLKTKRAHRRYTDRQLRCAHPWAHLFSFGNPYGRRENCGECDMRVSYVVRASAIAKGKGKSAQSSSTASNVGDQGSAQGSEGPMRVSKRSEEMAQYRALEAPMEVDGTGSARPRHQAPRMSVANEIKDMREEMAAQNHGLLALVVEQGKAIQNIQATQLGMQERQIKVEKWMAIEDEPKTPPPRDPTQMVFSSPVGGNGGSRPSSPDHR